MTENGRRGLVVAMIAVAALVGGFLWGCTSVSQERPDDVSSLTEQAREFHTNLRFARYEQASNVVHDAYRPTFEGEFEERGDDYEIVEMRLKRVDLEEGGHAAKVEVQQDWFVLPSTVVESERFVERWVFENGRWWMRERMQRDEYRDRDETFDSELSAESEESEDDPSVESMDDSEAATP